MASALPSTGSTATGIPTTKARGKRSFAHAVRDCSVPQAHQEYLQVRRAEGLRDSTLHMYAGALGLWERWYISQNVPLTSQITTKHAEEYLFSLQKEKQSERTIRNRAIVTKGPLKSAFKRGYLPSERLYGGTMVKTAVHASLWRFWGRRTTFPPLAFRLLVSTQKAPAENTCRWP